jgi:hypothetical protein
MTFDFALAGLATLALVLYLGYVLIYPEKF